MFLKKDAICVCGVSSPEIYGMPTIQCEVYRLQMYIYIYNNIYIYNVYVYYIYVHLYIYVLNMYIMLYSIYSRGAVKEINNHPHVAVVGTKH